MHFAPSGSNCGAATAARFLHLFKFGLVVFRRATFGDGRQSRRLPAAFLYRPGRTQRPEPEDKPCADQTQRPTPEDKPHAERSPHPAPSRPRPARPRSCPVPFGPAPLRTSTHRAARRRTVPFCAIRVQTSAPRAHLHLRPSPHPKKAEHAAGFARDLHPLFTTAA